jgi:hypothetical protein
MKIFVSYKPNANPDHEIAKVIEHGLKERGYHHVFVDRAEIEGSGGSTQILLDHIRQSQAVIALISNAGMNSKLVLHEIGRSLRPDKKIIPVILEDLKPEAYFRAFGLHFIDTDAVRYTGDDVQLLDNIHKTLRKKTDRRHKEVFQELIKAGDSHETDGVLLVLLYLLRDMHLKLAADQGSNYNDGLADVTGQQSGTPAETLLNLAKRFSEIHAKNAKIYSNSGLHNPAKKLHFVNSHLEKLSSILSTMMDSYQAEIEQVKSSGENGEGRS